MRIAVIAADLIPQNLGGAETHVVEVIKRLAGKGHLVELFVGGEDNIKKVFPKNVNVHTIWYPKITNLYGLLFIFLSPLQIIRKLKGKRVDVIWAKQVFPQAVSAVVVKKALNKPLYITAQNPLAYKEELVIKGQFPLKSWIPNLLTPLIKLALSQSDITANVSNYSRSQSLKLGSKKNMIIPNGIDIRKYEKRKMNKNSKVFNILTTSSLIPRNGIDTLIKAVSLLPKTIRFRLTIAGNGPEKHRLETKTHKLQLERKVEFLGRVKNNQIPDLLSQADIFVRPSRKEGFGVSFLEAMAAKVPVIATPVGGIVDFIIDGETGILVKPNKPQEAAEAIKLLKENEKLYIKLQKKAFNLVKKRYNWDKISDEVEKTFLSLT